MLTSYVPRTLETAVAMGFAVDDQLDALGDLPPDVYDEVGHHERWTWEAPFTRFAQLIACGGSHGASGTAPARGMSQALESIPAHGRVLVVSHGRIIESGVVACFPDEDVSNWGAPFQHCEGVRLRRGPIAI